MITSRIAARLAWLLVLGPGLLLPAAAWADCVDRADSTGVVAIDAAVLRDLDDAGRGEPVVLPLRRTLEPRRFRRFRLEAEFTIEDRSAAPMWAVYVRSLNHGGQLRVNDTVVGEMPGSTEDVAIQAIRPALFMVPPHLLVDGTNRLELLWSTHDSLQHLAVTCIGPRDTLERRFQQHQFWQNTMAQVGFDFALVNAAMLLGIFALRRSETRYLLMGLTSLSWLLVCLPYLLPPIPADLLGPWFVLRTVGIAMVAACSWTFFAQETRTASRWFPIACAAWAAVGPLGVLAIWLATGGVYSPRFEGGWGLVMIGLGAYPLVLLAREVRRDPWSRHAVFLGVTVIGAIAGAADIVQASSGVRLLGSAGYTAQAISPLWFGAIAIVLVRDFARSLAREQEQSALMTRRLAEQQAQLERLYLQDRERQRERAASEERQRIMQDMHDGLGSQLISALALSERGALDARQTSALLRECIDDLRLAIDSLDGSEDSFAVMAGNLRFRVEPRFRAAGVTLVWDAAGLREDTVVPTTQILPLLRILQECLSNALRHARATRIVVTLASGPGWLRLSVVDDGVGFDPARVRPGKGQAGMMQRARRLGATLSIDGTRGTAVTLALPLGARDAPAS